MCILTRVKSDIQRINITLPSTTLKRIDRLAPKGSRSRIIDEAVNYFLDLKNRAQLRKELIEGYKAWAERDLAAAQEMFDLGDVWD